MLNAIPGHPEPGEPKSNATRVSQRGTGQRNRKSPDKNPGTTRWPNRERCQLDRPMAGVFCSGLCLPLSAPWEEGSAFDHALNEGVATGRAFSLTSVLLLASPLYGHHRHLHQLQRRFTIAECLSQVQYLKAPNNRFTTFFHNDGEKNYI